MSRKSFVRTFRKRLTSAFRRNQRNIQTNEADTLKTEVNRFRRLNFELSDENYFRNNISGSIDTTQKNIEVRKKQAKNEDELELRKRIYAVSSTFNKLNFISTMLRSRHKDTRSFKKFYKIFTKDDEASSFLKYYKNNLEIKYERKQKWLEEKIDEIYQNEILGESKNEILAFPCSFSVDFFTTRTMRNVKQYLAHNILTMKKVNDKDATLSNEEIAKLGIIHNVNSSRKEKELIFMAYDYESFKDLMLTLLPFCLQIEYYEQQLFKYDRTKEEKHFNSLLNCYKMRDQTDIDSSKSYPELQLRSELLKKEKEKEERLRRLPPPIITMIKTEEARQSELQSEPSSDVKSSEVKTDFSLENKQRQEEIQGETTIDQIYETRTENPEMDLKATSFNSLQESQNREKNL